MSKLERATVKIISQDAKWINGKIWIDKRIDFTFAIDMEGMPGQLEGVRHMTTESMREHALYLEVYADICDAIRIFGLEGGLRNIKYLYGGSK